MCHRFCINCLVGYNMDLIFAILPPISGVDSKAAEEVMELIREKYVSADVSTVKDDASGIKLIGAVEFAYTDPIDGSQISKQGLILSFEYPTGDAARVVFRLSGTGSAGATIRMYLEKFEIDIAKHGEAAPTMLKTLADRALGLIRMEELTGRDAPTVIT